MLILSVSPLVGPILLRGTPPCVSHPAGIPLLSRVSPADANPPTPIPGAGFRTAPPALPGRIPQPGCQQEWDGHPSWRSWKCKSQGRVGWLWLDRSRNAGAHLGDAPTSLMPTLSPGMRWDMGWDGKRKDGKELDRMRRNGKEWDGPLSQHTGDIYVEAPGQQHEAGGAGAASGELW